MSNFLLRTLTSVNIHAHNRQSESDKDFRMKRIKNGKLEYVGNNNYNFENMSKDFVAMFPDTKDKRTAWAILKTKTKEWKHFVQTELGAEKNCNTNQFVTNNHLLPEHFREELYKDFFHRHKDDEDVKGNVSKIWLSAVKNLYHWLCRIPEKPVPDQKEIRNAVSFAPDFLDLDEVVQHCVDRNTLTSSEEHRPVILRDPDPYETSNNRPESDEKQAEIDRSKVDIKYVDYSPLEFLETYMETEDVIDSYMLNIGQAIHKNDVDKLQNNHLFKIFTRRARYYKSKKTQPISYSFLQLRRLMRENRKDDANRMLGIIHDQIMDLDHHKQVDIGDDANFECQAEHYLKTALEMTKKNGAPVIAQARRVGMDTRIQSITPFFFN